MNRYPEFYPVLLEFPLVDDNGKPVVATQATLTVANSEGVDIYAVGSADIEITDPVKIRIPEEFNYLDDGSQLDVRVAKLRLVTADGVITRTQMFAVTSETPLKVLSNSFVTFEKAALIAMGIVNLAGWASATDDAKITALKEAYSNIISMVYAYSVDTSKYRSRFDYALDFDIFGGQRVISPADWLVMKAADFQEMPLEFRAALMKAQILEANELLEGGVVSQKIRSGITSETIGESSITLNGNMLRTSVARSTLAVLGPYIYNRTVVARG